MTPAARVSAFREVIAQKAGMMLLVPRATGEALLFELDTTRDKLGAALDELRQAREAADRAVTAIRSAPGASTDGLLVFLRETIAPIAEEGSS